MITDARTGGNDDPRILPRAEGAALTDTLRLRLAVFRLRPDQEVKQLAVTLSIERDVQGDHLQARGRVGGVGGEHDLEALA